MTAEKVVCLVVLVLVVVGALNWGLHAFNYNIVDSLFGKPEESNITKGVYVAVAIAGVVVAVQMIRNKIKACPDDDKKN